MGINIQDANVVVNCAKTVIRILEETSILSKNIDFSKEEIQSSIDNLLNEKIEFKDNIIYHSVCIFCLEIAGLENFGLRYDYNTIQQTILNFTL